MSSGKELPTPQQCIEVMKQGTSMLKCTKRGKKHFRHFQLSSDLRKLTWKSPAKDSSEATIVIQSVKGILLGQKTPIFKKNKLPEYEHISFSLLYGEKTLDIICKDVREYEIWSTGLRSLTVDPQTLLVSFSSAISLSPSPSLSPSSSTSSLSSPSSPPSPTSSSSLSSPSYSEDGAGTSSSNLSSNHHRLASQETLQISFKGKQTVVVKREETADVYSWGCGQNGRLGHSDEQDLLGPKVVEALLGKGVRSISCGASHSAAVTIHGDIYTWGSGEDGKLGHGHDRDRTTPLTISALRGKLVVRVACGEAHTLILTDMGQVYTCGEGDLLPRHVQDLDVSVVYIAAGHSTSAAITDQGGLYMWGGNEKFQLGLGDNHPRARPTQVQGRLRNVPVSLVACGAWHTIAVSQDGMLYSWGDGSNGKLGLGDWDKMQSAPALLPQSPPAVVDVACGDFHSCCLTEIGEVYTWGEGNYGQLGHGAAVTQYNTPLQVGRLSCIKVAQIACGSNFTAVSTVSGEVFTWGYGAMGRLGHNNEELHDEPMRVDVLVGKQVQGIAAGGAHTAIMVVHGWVPDNESSFCMSCKAVFTTIRRRHHCRKCGGLFCGACTSKRVPILNAGLSDPVRVCEKCYSGLAANKK